MSDDERYPAHDKPVLGRILESSLTSRGRPLEESPQFDGFDSSDPTSLRRALIHALERLDQYARQVIHNGTATGTRFVERYALRCTS
jgi:hypothetical protein